MRRVSGHSGGGGGHRVSLGRRRGRRHRERLAVATSASVGNRIRAAASPSCPERTIRRFRSDAPERGAGGGRGGRKRAVLVMRRRHCATSGRRRWRRQRRLLQGRRATRADGVDRPRARGLHVAARGVVLRAERGQPRGRRRVDRGGGCARRRVLTWRSSER